MHYRTTVLSLLVTLFLIQLTHSQSITKVLQNGKGGYEGSKDSYTSSNGPDGNYGDKQIISHQNCQT